MGKYWGKGNRADLNNHANQLNPEHPEHDHSREAGSHNSDDDED